jgi:HEAT repeat protein
MHDPVPGLIQALSSDSPAERLRAADALAELADPRAVSALIPLLADSTQVARDQWVSESACYALRRIGDPALELLIAALKDANALLREPRIAEDGILPLEKLSPSVCRLTRIAIRSQVYSRAKTSRSIGVVEGIPHKNPCVSLVPVPDCFDHWWQAQA